VTVAQRIAAGLIRNAAARMWGVPPRLMNDIVERLGAGGALKWFVRNLPRYESTLKTWGPIRTHLVCIEASLLNSCAYCAHSHAYAFELFYFKERGHLFPLDEHEIVRLRDGSDVELRSALEGALREAELPDEIAALDRVWRLKFEAVAPESDDDRRAQHLLAMFDVLNYCAIDARTAIDEAHDPINKDKQLRLRYAEARLNAKRPA
jgi:hypothetical protein